MSTPATDIRWAWRETAEAMKRGEQLIERIAFWREIPMSGPILLRLADKLELACEEVEAYGGYLNNLILRKP